MTNWEQWCRGRNRKDIICAYEDHDGSGRCSRNCILYKFCSKEGHRDEKFTNDIEDFLDSEAVMEREAVILNLLAMRDNAEEHGYNGHVQILNRTIELLKED